MTPTLPTYDAAVRYVSELAHLKLDASYHHRLEMGTALALDPDMMQVDAHGQYRVLSSDRTTWYRVNGTCDCEAARYHHEPAYLCKHRAAVGIAKKARVLLAQQAQDATSASSAVPGRLRDPRRDHGAF